MTTRQTTERACVRSFAAESETAAFAARLSVRLRAGDCLLLSGEIGSGKTLFARAAIQAMMAAAGEIEDVPSPTFTLVQTYLIGGTEVWHADLYRLSGVFDVDELGLADAFDTAITLVEWPDRLGEEAPRSALRLDFSAGPGETDRRVRLSWSVPRWDFLVSDQWDEDA